MTHFLLQFFILLGIFQFYGIATAGVADNTDSLTKLGDGMCMGASDQKSCMDGIKNYFKLWPVPSHDSDLLPYEAGFVADRCSAMEVNGTGNNLTGALSCFRRAVELSSFPQIAEMTKNLCFPVPDTSVPSTLTYEMKCIQDRLMDIHNTAGKSCRTRLAKSLQDLESLHMDTLITDTNEQNDIDLAFAILSPKRNADDIDLSGASCESRLALAQQQLMNLDSRYSDKYIYEGKSNVGEAIITLSKSPKAGSVR